MRNDWLKTLLALLCAVALAGKAALATPTDMANAKRRAATAESGNSIWPWAKAKPTGVREPFVARAPQSPSFTRNPIEYLKSKTPALPFTSKGKMASAPRPTMPPANATPDALSLSTPSGPPTPEFFILAGQMCEGQHDIPRARANFQRALTMWPGNADVLRAAARMEDRQGNLPLAENLYGQVVQANPQLPGAHNDLGLCLARQGKLQDSLQMLEKAVQLQPDKPLYRNNAATVLIEMREDQRALAHLAAVHGVAEANYNLGQMLVDRGRANDAIAYFQAALQQNPNLQPAQEALAKLQTTKMANAAAPASTTQASIASQQAANSQTASTTGQVAAQPTGPNATAPPPIVNGAIPQQLPPVAARPGSTIR